MGGRMNWRAPPVFLFCFIIEKEFPEIMMYDTLDARLSCAADFVRDGAVLADVGTDHAYLPIALLSRGAISYAYAADVAKGPLATAQAHLDACSAELPDLKARIRLVLTDGLAGLEAVEPRVTDISICGMGGELIARILSDTDFVRNPDIRLILQPMTMQPVLRRWLADNGFCVEHERLCTANGKLYSVICCHYTGETTVLRQPLLGDTLLSEPDNADLLPLYLRTNIERLSRVVEGRTSAGVDCSDERAALETADRLLKGMCND